MIRAMRTEWQCLMALMTRRTTKVWVSLAYLTQRQNLQGLVFGVGGVELGKRSFPTKSLFLVKRMAAAPTAIRSGPGTRNCRNWPMNLI